MSWLVFWRGKIGSGKFGKVVVLEELDRGDDGIAQGNISAVRTRDAMGNNGSKATLTEMPEISSKASSAGKRKVIGGVVLCTWGEVVCISSARKPLISREICKKEREGRGLNLIGRTTKKFLLIAAFRNCVQSLIENIPTEPSPVTMAPCYAPSS